MKMLKFKYVISLFLGVSFMILSCEEDYLNRLPKDQISTDQYWETPSDLKLYVNQFYTSFWDGPTYSYGIPEFEEGTDNVISGVDFPQRFAGTRIVPTSGGGWNFVNIRDVNYFFEHYQKVEEEATREEYIQYVGEAHFFRAYYYFNLVQQFGDVSYNTETLLPNSEELYEPRTPRQQVIDSIIKDLDLAIEYMNSGPNEGGTRLNKEVAQLYKSRVCLYEGTWEKYHDGTVFGVENPKPDAYLQMAAEAAEAVINSEYHLYTDNDPENVYWDLFNNIDYSGNPEVMLWEKHDMDLDKSHNRQQFLNNIRNHGLGITKSLIDDYLCSDGEPIAKSSVYIGDSTLNDVMTNRDPRLNQTVWEPGDPEAIENGDTTNVFERARLHRSGEIKCPTGYEIQKGNLPDPNQYDSPYFGTTGSIHFRYAEALLNYAEAKAELGTLDQADIDLTINKLRDRVGMPHLNINNITEDPNWKFPDLSPIINEIRRERRVELALEDFRWFDLARWRAHEAFVGTRPRGVRFDPEMYPEIEVGVDVKLDDEGYVVVYKDRLGEEGYQFDPERDYLDPIPTNQLTLNENLEQNPGW